MRLAAELTMFGSLGYLVAEGLFESTVLKCHDMSKRVVENPDPESIIVKGRGIFYRALAVKIKGGSRIFVEDMGRKQAHYARKVFSGLVGVEVLGYPVMVNGKDGYLFHKKMFT